MSLRAKRGNLPQPAPMLDEIAALTLAMTELVSLWIGTN